VTGGLFQYATSHRIVEVGPVRLRKDLRDEALIGAARFARPAFVHDFRREPIMYRAVLTPGAIGPQCYDSGDDWVELERINAPVLWQVGDARAWVAVATWVAGMHRRLAVQDVAGVPLLVHDASLLAAWRERAGAAGAPAHVLVAHERASRRLVELPKTLIHGDLYASNLLVRSVRAAGIEVWPVDWELAGMGPAVIDVAALTAGSGLAPTTKTAMERAYFDAARYPTGAWKTWVADLDAARLHQCVQWLGWAPTWIPPVQHRHDWLSQAMQLAELQ
jgi:Ser/Thr protein kinase RdoA (MazF antagonist)